MLSGVSGLLGCLVLERRSLWRLGEVSILDSLGLHALVFIIVLLSLVLLFRVIVYLVMLAITLAILHLEPEYGVLTVELERRGFRLSTALLRVGACLVSIFTFRVTRFVHSSRIVGFGRF